MREAVREILSDLPDAIIAAAAVAAFMSMVITFAAIGAGA